MPLLRTSALAIAALALAAGPAAAHKIARKEIIPLTPEIVTGVIRCAPSIYAIIRRVKEEVPGRTRSDAMARDRLRRGLNVTALQSCAFPSGVSWRDAHHSVAWARINDRPAGADRALVRANRAVIAPIRAELARVMQSD